MSFTRTMIERIRSQLGAAKPLAAISEIPTIEIERVGHLAHGLESNDATTALIGIGAIGTRYATDVVLQFQAELAVAHRAVATLLEDNWAEKNNFLPVKSRVENHRQFLLRPDLGRRLCPESVKRIEAEAKKNIDVQPIIADGLSALACMQSGSTLLQAYINECESLGLSVGSPIAAKFARVWLEDEIGQLTKAKVGTIMLGERPGLGTGDGLSAYLVYQPKIGNTDSDRNMMSNIHERGTPPAQAAKRLALLSLAMIKQQVSGVNLDLEKETGLADLAANTYRAPQVREALVKVNHAT